MQQNVLFTTASFTRNIIRSYARKSVLKKKNANPGIQKRLNVLTEKEDSSIEDVDFDELESDFMQVDKAHQMYENELKYYREKEKFWIVKRKYFKEKQINFLTWNDKEQIRYLHQTNPNEWTIEKLSEGFPALPNTIKKIIKNNWQKSESKKQNHDKAVVKNWELFKTGKLSDVLTPDIVNHLSKFSSRKLNSDNNMFSNKTIIKESNSKKEIGEFSSIISSYQKLKQKPNQNLEQKAIDYPEINKTTSVENNLKLFGNKSVPLSIVKDKFTTNQVEKVENSDIIIKSNDLKYDISKKYEQNNTSVSFSDNKNNVNVVSYPEKITIPKNKYKKGYTYKVNDCYYDDDGEFLYRVPGMY